MTGRSPTAAELRDPFNLSDHALQWRNLRRTHTVQPLIQVVDDHRAPESDCYWCRTKADEFFASWPGDTDEILELYGVSWDPGIVF